MPEPARPQHADPHQLARLRKGGGQLHTSTVRLTDRQWKLAKRKMADDQLTWQAILSAAVNAYILGHFGVTPSGRYTVWPPGSEAPAVEDPDGDGTVDLAELWQGAPPQGNPRPHSSQDDPQQRQWGTGGRRWGTRELAAHLRYETGRRVNLTVLRKLLRRHFSDVKDGHRWKFDGPGDPTVARCVDLVADGELDRVATESYAGLSDSQKQQRSNGGGQ